MTSLSSSTRVHVGRLLVRPAALVAGILLANSVLAFIRDLLSAAKFGASAGMDAFFVANSLPILWYALAAAAANYGFIPFGSRLISRGDSTAFREGTTRLLALSATVGALLTATCFLLARPLADVLVVGRPELVGDVTLLIQLLAPLLFGFSLVQALNAVANSRRDFLAPAHAATLSLAVVLAALLVAPSDRSGIVILGAGTVAGGYAQAAWLLLWRKAWRGLSWHDLPRASPLHLASLRLLGLGLAGWLAWQTSQVVDRTFASLLPEGSIAIAGFALRLVLVSLVVVWPLCTTLLTHMASAEPEDRAEYLSTAIRTVVGLILPAACLFVLLGASVFPVLYGRGSFSADAAVIGGSLTAFYGFALVPVVLMLVLNTSAFAVGRVEVAAVVGLAALALDAALDFVLVKTLGIRGLPFAMAITNVTWAALLVVGLRGRVRQFPWRPLAASISRFVIAAFGLTAMVLFCSFLPLEASDSWQQLLRLTLLGGAGAAAYAVSLVILRAPEIAMLRSALTRSSLVSEDLSATTGK